MSNKAFYIFMILIFSFLNSCVKEESAENPIDDPYNKIITGIAVENNNIWVGTFKNGLYKFDGDLWTTYRHPDDLVSDAIRAITVSNNGTVWIGTDQGISKLENQDWSNITELDGLFNNDIRSLDSDSENNIWIGTRNNRLIKYNGGNFTTYHVNSDESGPNESGHIHTITHDFNGNIWVGSCISGLSKFDEKIWTDNINNLNFFVESSICSIDGDIWIGHYTGAYKFSNDIWTRYTDNDGLPSRNILCFTIDQQNNIWIGTDSGLSKFDGSEWKNFTTDNGLISNNITALACDQNGDLWVGTESGLSKLSL